MPGVELSEGGWLHVSKTDDAGTVEAEAKRLAGDFGAAVEFWPAERVREQLDSSLYFSAIHHPRGFSIHPLNYAFGLAADAEAHGARIYEETPALEIDPAGVRKRIVTKDSRVRAAHVVLAGNVHLTALMPQFANTLSPVFTYVIATGPLGPQLREAIRYPGAVSDTELADNHYRVVDGDRLIWSGRSTVWQDRPQRYVNTLLADIARAYPQLHNVKAEYAWNGTLGITVHRMPQIGEISPGLWLLSGFGGHGLNSSAMGGDLIARAIIDNDRRWELFSPFEMVWAGGLFGRAAQQLYYWSFRTHELAAGWLARQREKHALEGGGEAGSGEGAQTWPGASDGRDGAAGEAGPLARLSKLARASQRLPDLVRGLARPRVATPAEPVAPVERKPLPLQQAAFRSDPLAAPATPEEAGGPGAQVEAPAGKPSTDERN
jgi:glycine/D-amino acid oxidase-like deaminating enzyme